jgi:hypothetical protein
MILFLVMMMMMRKHIHIWFLILIGWEVGNFFADPNVEPEYETDEDKDDQDKEMCLI